jgi:hypothetical protein
MFWLFARYEVTPGPPATFACPRCGAGPVPADSYRRTEILSLFAVIPLGRTHMTHLVCGNCSAHLFTKLTLDDLYQCIGVDISRFVFYRVSFILKSLAVLSLLLCWAPVVGLGLSLITFIGTFKWPSVWRTIAIICLVLSFVVTSLFIIVLILGG